MLAILNFFTAINESAFPNKQKQISFPSVMKPWREAWILHVNVLYLDYLFLTIVYFSLSLIAQFSSINTMPASQVRTLL